jgi:hypothetical protein
VEGHVLRVLQADNPWLSGGDLRAWCTLHLPKRFIPRTTLIPDTQPLILVVGPRQAGKSTLIWHHLASYDKPFLFLNCEEPALQEWLISPTLVWEDIKGLVGEPVSLFFEEIQRLPEAGLFLKGMADRKIGVPIYATGSSSFDLESKTRESLAGRATRRLLLPFSLSEVSQTKKTTTPVLKNQFREEQLGRMLWAGGYPTAFLAGDPERELAALVEAFIIRDASDRFRIKNPVAFRKLLELAASQIGNLCNFSHWASITGISNDTVAEHVSLLEDTHILRLIRPFFGGKRAEIKSAPKVFFVDNGIRNIFFGGFQPLDTRSDRGQLIENFAFTEIIKVIHPLLDSVRYWRSKAGAEVDFVIEHQGRLAACEIKAGDPRERIPRSSLSFIEAYQPEMFVIVGNSEHPARKVGKTLVRFETLSQLAWVIEKWRAEGRS